MSEFFIAGDWGTTNLRLWLRRGAAVLDVRTGPGALAAGGAFETTLFDLIQPWLDQHPAAPVILCGMVGSRIGWVEAPYAACPAGAEAIAAQGVRLTARGAPILLVPGVTGPSPRGAPDVMRGEETQILGALQLDPRLAVGRHLLVLPGTHTKWVEVEDARIVAVQTAPAGELFALLRHHGALALHGAETPDTPGEGFIAGLARSGAGEPGGLLHALFETRSRRLVDGWSETLALDFLSGLLIGADVAGGLALFAHADGAAVLVGDPRLNLRYQAAFARHGRAAEALDGEACALAGLGALFNAASPELAP